MFRKSLLSKILVISVGITAIGLVILVNLFVSSQREALMEEKFISSELLAQPILSTIYKDMLDERADLVRFLMEGMKTLKGVERLQIIRSNGTEEAFMDFKTLKEVEKEYGDLKTEWKADHFNVKNNIAKGIENPKFKEIFSSFRHNVPNTYGKDLKDIESKGKYYLEEFEGKQFFTYLQPIEFRPKCNACHSKHEDARGMLMITTSMEELNAKVSRNTVKWSVYGMLAILATAIALSILIKRFVVNPIVQTTAMLEIISNGGGDLTRQLAVISTDEVGRLSLFFNKFTDGMRTLVKGVFKTSEELTAVSKSIKHITENIQASSILQIQEISITATSLNEMDATITTVLNEVKELLKVTENAASSSIEISAAVSEIADNTEQLDNSMDVTTSAIFEISSSISQMSANVGELFEQTEQVESATAEVNNAFMIIGELSKEEANLAERVVAIVTDRLDAAGKSNTVIEKIIKDVAITSAAMGNLGERTKKISNIVNVITEITDTTNLLALNAGILAAQAGEHGKSFAVVADEVKNLAKRTAASTKEISELIKQVQKDVASAVEFAEKSSSALVEETLVYTKGANVALENIAISSKASLAMAEKIEKATHDQHSSVSSMTSAIQKIKSTVSQVRKAAEEQGKVSGAITNAIETVRNISHNVRRYTSEQSNESNVVSNIIVNVDQKLKSVSKSMDTNRRAYEKIVKVFEVVKYNSEVNNKVVVELNNDVAKLQEQSGELNHRVDNFKV